LFKPLCRRCSTPGRISRRAVTGALVGDQHPRRVREALEQLPQEAHGGGLIAPGRHQDSKHVAVRVDRPPARVLPTVARDEHLVEVPRVAGPQPPTAQFVRVGLAELATPLAHRLVRHDNAALGEELLHSAVTAGEAAVQPDRVTNDRSWEALALVEGRERLFFHAPRIAHQANHEADQLS